PRRPASAEPLRSQRFLSCVCCRTVCELRGGLCPAYRKLRLFAVACCRRVLHLLPDAVCLRAIEAAEQYIEGALTERDCQVGAHAFDLVRRKRFPKFETPDDGAWPAVYCACHRRWEARFDEPRAKERWQIAVVVAGEAATSGGSGEAGVQATLMRDLFGNPFRRVAVDPTWLTPV